GDCQALGAHRNSTRASKVPRRLCDQYGSRQRRARQRECLPKATACVSCCGRVASEESEASINFTAEIAETHGGTERKAIGLKRELVAFHATEGEKHADDHGDCASGDEPH